MPQWDLAPRFKLPPDAVEIHARTMREVAKNATESTDPDRRESKNIPESEVVPDAEEELPIFFPALISVGRKQVRR